MKRHFWAFMAIVCLLTVQNTQGQQMVLAQKKCSFRVKSMFIVTSFCFFSYLSGIIKNKQL